MSTVNTPVAFLELPDELVELIILKLHPLDMVKCRPVCKYLLELIDASMEIQVRIELCVDGYLLNYRGNLPASALMEKVLARRRSMEHLQPFRAWKVDCPDTGGVAHEVCDGIWSHSISMSSEETFRGIHMEELVSPEVYGDRWQLERNDLNIDATDFSFNVAEDALILMEMSSDGTYRRMHFRTLSTNEIHPASAAPFLDIPKSSCSVWTKCSTMINGYYVLLMFAHIDLATGRQIGGALILDWRKASIVMPFRNASSAVFIAEQHLLLMLNGEEDFPEGIAMEVYSLSEGKALRQFNLPFKEPALLARFMGHPLSHYGDSCPATKSTMFTPDPLLDIVGCVFFVHRGITQQFVAVMSVRQLIQLSTQDQQEGFRLEWSKWGKFAAQWLSHRVVRYVGFRATFGSQMLVKIRQFDDNGMWLGNSIALLDFNQRAIQRRKEKTEMGTRVHRIVADGITRNFLTFGMGWTSTLSFRAFVSCGMVTHSNFYLDANTIVGRTDNAYNFFSFFPDTYGTTPQSEFEDLALFVPSLQEAEAEEEIPPQA